MKIYFNKGLSLIEMLVMIVVVGILASVAMQSMDVAVEDVRRVKTERELEMLSNAIVGDPLIMQAGSRSDFGYIGDVGAFPANLQALHINPGGYATWNGPYIESGYTEDIVGFKTDEWGSQYAYTGSNTITSTGSGTSITKKIANATSDYTLNSLNGTIMDANDSLPGSIYKDSVDVKITIPNGLGGTTTKIYTPNSSGQFTLDSLPVGKHKVDIIYKPNSDTLHRYITILPRHKSPVVYNFASSYFAAGGGGGGGGGGSGSIVYVNGTANTYGGNCEDITFDITNTSGSAISISNIKVSWGTPTAYYKKVKWAGDTVIEEDEPMASSGNTYNFNNSKSISAGATVTMIIENFEEQADGEGNDVNMANTDMTIEFSDGSIITFNTGTC